MTFSDGLAVAAIALSLSTIFFGVLFYRWQTEQGARISDTVNNFAKEMHAVLGEIKGLTTGTWQELREQFKFVLGKALNQERASIGEEVGPRVDALEGQLGELEVKLSATGDADLRTIVADLKRDVSRLKGELAGLRAGAASAGKGLLTDRDQVLRITQDFLSSGRSSMPPLRAPATPANIRLLLADLLNGPIDDAAWLAFRYGDAFDAAETTGLIEVDYKGDQPGVRLTDAGRAFLGAGPPTKNGVAE